VSEGHPVDHRSWRYNHNDGVYYGGDMATDKVHVEIYVSATGRSQRVFVNGTEIKWREL